MLKRFLHWWIGELACVLRLTGGRRSSSSSNLLEVELGKTSIRVTPRLAGRNLDEQTLELEAVGKTNDQGRQWRQSLPKALHVRDTPVRIIIPASHRLEQTVELPLAAEENLREVLDFEMDRLTPLKASAVYFDGRIEARNRQSNLMTVALTLVPKGPVDTALDALASWGYGVAKRAIHVEHDAEQVYLQVLPPPRPPGLLARVNLLLVACVTVLLLANWYLVFAQQRSYASDLRHRIDALRPVAVNGVARQDQHARLAASLDRLVAAKLDAPSMTVLMEEISQRLPDGTWLQRLSLHADRAQLVGVSDAATSLVKALEASALFTDVHFVSSVVKDERSGGERFHIAARYQAGGQPQ